MDLLLDTNILIDHFGNRNGFADDAHKVFAFALFGDATLWAMSSAFVNAFYILRKGRSPEDIQSAFQASYPYVKVCSAGAEDLANATSRQWRDLEDCLVAVCAEKLHADYIVTRDVKGFARSSVPAISPTELLERMRERGITYDFFDL